MNRDIRTGDASDGLTRKWDGQRLMEEMGADARIRAAFGQQASQAIGDYAKQQMGIAVDLHRQAQKNPEKAVELTSQAQEIEKNWGDSGVLRILAHGVVGAFSEGVPGLAGAVSGTLVAPIFANALREANTPSPLADFLTALATTAAGGITGGAAGASAAFNEVTGNFLPDVVYLNIVKSCLSGNTCPDDESKKKVLEQAEKKSQEYDNAMLFHCNSNPTGDICKKAVTLATQYVAMTEAWEVMRPDVSRSSHVLFSHLYNSPNASERFSEYFNNPAKKSDFYGASKLYEKNIGAGARWYGAAELATRSPLIGGGKLITSVIPFAAGNLIAPLEPWRNEASPTVIVTGFESFKELYTNKNANPIKWDIDFLKKEQSTLQPIHEKYLKNSPFIVDSIKNLTDSENLMSRAIPEGQRIKGGVQILDRSSRIKYGCRLLGYTENQGCKP